MKKIVDLSLGYADAVSYRRSENRDFLNRVFIRNRHLDRLCQPDISFLVGEKGTGKTAYAVYLTNNDYNETLATNRFLRETDYVKFMTLKRQNFLDLSDYTSIWKVIIYVLLSEQLKSREIGLIGQFTRFRNVQLAMDEYANYAFSPEITQALQFVQESKLGAELISKHAKLSGEEKDTTTFSEARFQANLHYIRKSFEGALSQVRPKKSHILFIDGIDVRPSNIPLEDYLECVKGLANAVWEINTDFFPSIKGGKGKLRVVLLVRPDIFVSLGLQNLNIKSRENSVYLDWRTEYTNYRNSDLFKVIDHLLASQQDRDLIPGAAWDHYFPWDPPTEEPGSRSSFISFMRFSYYRPRDIATMLKILQDNMAEKEIQRDWFLSEEFDDPVFRRQYSTYLLGEVKDHLTFYHSSADYELFLKFFDFLNGKATFSFDEYLSAYDELAAFAGSRNGEIPPAFVASSSAFLQFLYDLNVVSYTEKPENDKPFIHWCFRECRRRVKTDPAPPR